jgi:protein-tyrosine-phosphatase
MPDPYYGDAGDFERVLDLTIPAAAALLKAIRESADVPINT